MQIVNMGTGWAGAVLGQGTKGRLLKAARDCEPPIFEWVAQVPTSESLGFLLARRVLA